MSTDIEDAEAREIRRERIGFYAIAVVAVSLGAVLWFVTIGLSLIGIGLLIPIPVTIVSLRAMRRVRRSHRMAIWLPLALYLAGTVATLAVFAI